MITPHSAVLENYVWWENGFTDEQISYLQNLVRTTNVSPAGVGGVSGRGVDTNIRRSDVGWLKYNSETNWIYERLGFIVSQINARYYRFDLTGFGESLQLTHYESSYEGMYGWHQDYNGGFASRKLSLVLQLSDPSEYEGGNLEIMNGGNIVTVRKQRGLLAIFPSYTLHQVTPVTKGTRQTIVAWVSGPAFR